MALFFLLGTPTFAQEAAGQGLFPPNHPGFFVGRFVWRVGDPLQIRLDSKLSLSVKSVRTAQRNATRELSAEAETSPLRVIPPVRTNSDFQLEAGVQRQFQGSLLGLVREVLPDGNLRVIARRSLDLSGGLEELEIEGIAAPRLIRGNTLDLHDLAELRLTLRLPAQGRPPEDTAHEVLLQKYWSQFWDSLIRP